MTKNEGWREKFRPDIPSPARIYDLLLGGKDNYPADRAAAGQITRVLPGAQTSARWNRAFLGRAVRYLAADRGIRQFLDLGAGLPSARNVHEVAQEAAPGSQVVYVDNDPVVLAHGRDLLHGVAGTTILAHDLREPDEILADPGLRALIDAEEPVAVLAVAVLHFIPDEDDPAGIIRKLLEPFPAGSHVVVSHGTADAVPAVREAAAVFDHATTSAHTRTRDEILALADGLELVEPGIVWLPRWRPQGPTGTKAGAAPAPDLGPALDPAEAYVYALVARKP